MHRIVAVDVVDVRFPTSDALDGSDAMHPDPDYSAAYVVLRTDARDADELGGQGHGLTFTIGRGTEVVSAAVDALLPMVVGIDVDELMGDLGRFAGCSAAIHSCAGSGRRRVRSIWPRRHW